MNDMIVATRPVAVSRANEKRAWIHVRRVALNRRLSFAHHHVVPLGADGWISIDTLVDAHLSATLVPPTLLEAPCPRMIVWCKW
jgi:hypothetical protein